MATRRIPILGASTVPDTGGNTYFESLASLGSNDQWQRLVARFSSTTARSGIYGGFVVPKDYVDTANIIIVWTSNAGGAGNCVWDFDYRAVGGNDTESLDQVGTQESVSVTDGGPSAAFERMEASVAVTDGNFAVDDEVEFYFVRDAVDAADTLTTSALLFSLMFEYNDA